MRRNIPMGIDHHLAFIPLALVVMLVVICGSSQTESPEAGWDVRLDGTGARCSGWLEILHRSRWRRISVKMWKEKSAELACKQLGCGSPFGNLDPYAKEPEKQEVCLLECQGNETTLRDCLWHESNCTHHPGVALVCQDPVQTSTISQPTTAPSATSSKPTDTPMIMLNDETSLCSGTVELNFGGRWEMVCLGLQNWWNGLAPRSCQGAGCEDLRGLKELRGKESLPVHWEQVQCERRNLSLNCLDGTETCLTITLVKCLGQDSKPGGSSTETALGILLGLVLTAVLLMICVPHIYKKVMKKYSKKQHQWIGPHGANQSVSFHCNSSATLQPHPQSQFIQKEETNAFKRNTHLSPYAALEGTANRISNPLDNSSDSDYDLCSAQPL
nr:T-cell surface glycoprotein CD5 isoform X1 [Pogona vitticeps]XP_020647918.1 T-cell surface glycoprotein CD5 isoform X1 [Pogona vitticeps]